jgi:hypothetical protein
MKTIKCWLDSGANIHSMYETEFEVEDDEWGAMTEEQKDEVAREHAWNRMEWGWREA